VKLVALFDSCHSGTILDLPFSYRSSGQIKTEGEFGKKEFGMLALNAVMDVVTGKGKPEDIAKLFGKEVFNGVKGKILEKENKVSVKNSSPADVIQLSGCKDEQTSADANIGGQATGAMSFALLAVMAKNHDITLLDLLLEIRTFMEEKNFTQIPQMCLAHKMDPATKFQL